MVRIAFDGFARKGKIRAREAPVPGLRQDVLGNHRNGIPLAEDCTSQEKVNNALSIFDCPSLFARSGCLPFPSALPAPVELLKKQNSICK